MALRPSAYRDGTVGVTGNRATPSDAVPSIVVAGEQYNVLARLAAQGRPVSLRVELRTRYFEEDRNSYNVIAEIPDRIRRCATRSCSLARISTRGTPRAAPPTTPMAP